MRDEPEEIQGGCRYFAASGCLLGFGAVLIVILLIIAAITFVSAGFHWLWSLL